MKCSRIPSALETAALLSRVPYCCTIGTAVQYGWSLRYSCGCRTGRVERIAVERWGLDGILPTIFATIVDGRLRYGWVSTVRDGRTAAGCKL